MPTPQDSGQKSDSASLTIDASPERVYEIVSDIAQMGRLSPECTGGRWIGKPGRAEAGARFLGFNKRGWFRWATVNQVVAAEPGREFTFDTKQSGTRWRFRIEPEPGGCRVTEEREAWRDRPALARLTSRLFLGGIEEHDDEMRDGLVATLQRLKAVAEAG